MATFLNDLKILDPSSGLYRQADNDGTSVLLLNILIELRVMNVYLQAMNPGIVTEELAQLRIDACNDPTSLQPFQQTFS